MKDKHIYNHDEMGEWFRKAGLDEPSDQFTVNVMQSVRAIEMDSPRLVKKHYYWWILILPVIIAGIWAMLEIPALSSRTLLWRESLQSFYMELNTSISGFFNHFKTVTISPLVILGFLAILSLLLIDDIFIKTKSTSPS